MHGAVSRFAYVTALTLCRNGQCRVECLVHRNGFLYRLKSSFSRNISKHSPANTVIASHSPQGKEVLSQSKDILLPCQSPTIKQVEWCLIVVKVREWPQVGLFARRVHPLRVGISN